MNLDTIKIPAVIQADCIYAFQQLNPLITTEKERWFCSSVNIEIDQELAILRNK
ncbi:hypothetical protein [Fluviicola taffensis]|uniref:hypothetical protein n=1 Tax=Fluviicola taffensis TaxID=191579 RepID=UPI0031377DDF